MQEELSSQTKKLVKQGEWFRLAEMEKGDRQWSEVLQRLSEDARAWCLKAAVRVLPDASNKRVWYGRHQKLCACGKMATDAHVLSACELSLKQYEWRHNGALLAIDEALRAAAGKGWQVHTDLKGQEHSQAWLAAHGVVQLKRPDILLAKQRSSGEVEKVVLVELSCVWERELRAGEASEMDVWASRAKEKGAKWTDAIGRRRAAKRQKYEETVLPQLPKEWKPQLWTVEVGDRGMLGPETKQ